MMLVNIFLCARPCCPYLDTISIFVLILVNCPYLALPNVADLIMGALPDQGLINYLRPIRHYQRGLRPDSLTALIRPYMVIWIFPTGCWRHIMRWMQCARYSTQSSNVSRLTGALSVAAVCQLAQAPALHAAMYTWRVQTHWESQYSKSLQICPWMTNQKFNFWIHF